MEVLSFFVAGFVAASFQQVAGATGSPTPMMPNTERIITTMFFFISCILLCYAYMNVPDLLILWQGFYVSEYTSQDNFDNCDLTPLSDRFKTAQNSLSKSSAADSVPVARR